MIIMPVMTSIFEVSGISYQKAIQCEGMEEEMGGGRRRNGGRETEI